MYIQKTFVFIGMTLLLLQTHGCGALVAGVAGGAVAAHDRRPSTTMLEDEAIELTAVDLLYNNPELSTTVHINVTSYNHVVLLTGEALSTSLRDKAIDIVRNINRVKRVHNEVHIADLANFKSRTKDTWITSKVKTRMLTTENFDATRIKVITENRTVYLMGLVTNEQGNEAAELARHIEGVTRVIKLFEYKAEDKPEPVQTSATP